MELAEHLSSDSFPSKHTLGMSWSLSILIKSAFLELTVLSLVAPESSVGPWVSRYVHLITNRAAK